MFRQVFRLTLPLALFTSVACSENSLAPNVTARVVSVTPSGGTTGVDPTAPIVITFDRPMQAGMERYAAVHEGDVTGPTVSGVWTWSDDRTMLTFAPSQMLNAAAQYTLHLGGGMRAADGGFVDYSSCVGQYGGRWVTQQMMSGGMMSGGMMGSGWRHPNGTFGMAYTFMTA